MDFLTILVSILVACACIHILLSKRRSSCQGKLPPGPAPIPIVGNLFRLGDKPNESLAELAKLFGPLMTLWLGQKRIVVVSFPSIAKEVLQKNDQAFAGRRVADAFRALNYHESSLIWCQPSTRWRRLRMICNTQMFTAGRLAANQNLRRKKVHDLIDHVRECCMSRRAVDIGQAALVTTLNLISNTFFSVDLVGLSSDSAQEFKQLIWGIAELAGKPNLVDYFPVLRPIDPQRHRRRMTAYLKKLHEIFDRMIQQRLQSRAESSAFLPSTDFLDVLLHHEKEKGLELDLHDIKALLVDIFTAGSDTTSATIEWAMAELLRNPHTMEKARLELIQTISPGQQAEESDIARLPYLQAVVKETFRLHPPAPFVIRKTETDVELGGFIIPKNTAVNVNVWAIGRDDNVWANSSSFMPERFLGSKIDFKGQDFELIPFGSGRRICPAIPLASRMIHLILASLLHSFTWKIHDMAEPQDMDRNTKFGTTVQLANPLLAIPALDE